MDSKRDPMPVDRHSRVLDDWEPMGAQLTARKLGKADSTALGDLYSQSRGLLMQNPAFPSASSGNDSVWYGVFNGTELRLAVPLIPRPLRLGMQSLQSPLFSPFGGLLTHDHDNLQTGGKAERFWRDHLGALHEVLSGEADRIELLFPPFVSDLRTLAWKGWSLRPHYNCVTTWEKDSEWRTACESSVRRQAKKAEQNELAASVIDASETKDLEALWTLNAEKQKLDPGLSQNIAQLGSWLNDQQQGFGVTVRDVDAQPHAAGLFGYDEHRVYYLAGASDPAHLGSGAPTLLHFSVLSEIERQGLPRHYDWVGANTQQVVRFKRGFNPRLEVLFAATLESRRWRALQTTKRLVS